METICLQCGDVGITNAFVYCVRCLNYAVHRYCLHVIPDTFDEFVRWFCDDCAEIAQKHSGGNKKDDKVIAGEKFSEDSSEESDYTFDKRKICSEDSSQEKKSKDILLEDDDLLADHIPLNKMMKLKKRKSLSLPDKIPNPMQIHEDEEEDACYKSSKRMTRKDNELRNKRTGKTLCGIM